MTTFELKTAKDGKFYFNLTEPPPVGLLLSSDKFATKEETLHAIDRVKRNAPLEERYERKTSSAGRHFFVLKGDDHQILGTSNRFDTEDARDSALTAVMSNAAAAAVSDPSST